MNLPDPSDDDRRHADEADTPAAVGDQSSDEVAGADESVQASPDAESADAAGSASDESGSPPEAEAAGESAPEPAEAGEVEEAGRSAPELPPAAAESETPSVEGGEDEEAKMDWYILKVAFNREDSIAEALRKRVKMEGMEEYFGDIVVPTEDVATFTRDGKRRVSKRKLLPGYVMVNMAINDDTWFLVRETAGISDFTGAAGKPMPMEPEDVERFIYRGGEEDEEEATIKTAIPFKVGDRVRVKEGNFENQEGEVDAVDEANGRVTVIINIFGRSVPMELDHWQVEPL